MFFRDWTQRKNRIHIHQNKALSWMMFYSEALEIFFMQGEKKK
jgi:hypothetical protein